jgi:acetyl esterase/lipase
MEASAMTNASGGRVTFENDVVFGRGGGRDLKLDIYRPPEGASNRCGVLLVHGGGWSGGDRTQLRGFGILLGRVGYTCVASEYRLSGEAKWPAQIHDVKAALRWMRANAADLGIDPSKIAVSGNSAGAHLSLVLAGTANKPEFEGDGGHPGVSTEVAAAVGIYPPTALMRRREGQGPTNAVGALMGSDATEEDYAGANPLTYARGDFPPTMLVHGNKDQTVPVGDSFKMYEKLAEAGAGVELHVFNGQPHAFDAAPDYGREVAALIDLFLRRHVLGLVPAGAAGNGQRGAG